MREARQRRLRGAQAASLLFAAACREHSGDVVSQSSRGFFTTRRRGVRQAAGRSRLAACAPRNIVAALSPYCAYRANPVRISCCEERIGRHRRNPRAVDGDPAHRDRRGEFSGLQSCVGFHQRTWEHGRAARAAGELGGLFPGGNFHERAFALLAWRALPRSVAGTLGFLGLVFFAGGYLAAAFFPCEGDCRSAHPGFSQAMHNFFGLAGYLTAPLSLWALAAGGFFVGLRMGGRCDGALRTSFSVAGLPIRGRGAANPGSERARLDGGLRSLSSTRALPSVGKAARRR